MNWKKEYNAVVLITGLFLLAYFLPFGRLHFPRPVRESLVLLQWYAREHVITCLIPAFFIAGIISVFISQGAVIKYFGADAKQWIAYGMASISGTVLAVCSCTILPLFSSIYKRGAGLGPAIAFLYSGPAINIMAIILTGRILGMELGLARVFGAVSFSVVIGFFMHIIYRNEEGKKDRSVVLPETDPHHPFGSTILHSMVLIAILLFANWGSPAQNQGIWFFIGTIKWRITALFAVFLAISLYYFLHIKASWILAAASAVLLAALIFQHPLVPFTVAIIMLAILLAGRGGDAAEWLAASWGFAKQIVPLLAAGVLVAGLLFGSAGGGRGLIPETWVAALVGGNSLSANFFASLLGALMYFATLTEVPIIQGLIASGMGKGPALALLLAGPALSLPNMLVIRSVLGSGKTLVFLVLVVIMATICGLGFGALYN